MLADPLGQDLDAGCDALEADAVDVLGGGQVASVGKQIATQLSYLQFPPAAANAMVLLVAVVVMIALLVRVVDIRKEL